MSLENDFLKDRAWQNGPGIQAGSDVERFLLGVPVIPPDKKALAKEHMPYAKAMDFVRPYQPNVLERSSVIKRLRSMVADLCNDKTTPVKFYTSVETPLDRYHGVDGWFEQNGRFATVDVSLREKEIHKADVFLPAIMKEDGSVVVPEEEIANAAQAIAECLNADSKRRVA